MLREKIVMMNQREYIEYVRKFAEAHGKHIWLGGSFLRGNPTPYSDVDISAVLDKDSLRTFIYGYGEPVYLSYTTNPKGIIIVIYEDGITRLIDLYNDKYPLDVKYRNLCIGLIREV